MKVLFYILLTMGILEFGMLIGYQQERKNEPGFIFTFEEAPGVWGTIPENLSDIERNIERNIERKLLEILTM